MLENFGSSGNNLEFEGGIEEADNPVCCGVDGVFNDSATSSNDGKESSMGLDGFKLFVRRTSLIQHFTDATEGKEEEENDDCDERWW